MGKDLGTYHVRVEFADGRGFIHKWETGPRFSGGRHSSHPLDAQIVNTPYINETELFDAIFWQFTEGNYGCDCNKLLYLADAAQEEVPENTPCGETIVLKRLTAIRPDLSEVVIYECEDEK